MSSSHLSATLAAFEATMQRTKNRLISIPAEVQHRLGLERRQNNHIVFYSIRTVGQGRWNHHLAYLTFDNEFAVPADVPGIQPGSRVEVKIRRVHSSADHPLVSGDHGAGGALLAIAQAAGDDDRVDGSRSVDEYLYSENSAGE